MDGVVILGRHRSGTTFLANSLSDSGFYTPTHACHNGQVESFYFSHVMPLVGISTENESVKAADLIFRGSDFYRIMRRDFNGENFSVIPLNATQSDVFVNVISDVARYQKAHGWLEKTPNNLLSYRALKGLRNTKFIFLRRDYLSTTKSVLLTFYKKQTWSLCVREAALTAIYHKIERRAILELGGLALDYQYLVNSKTTAELQLSEFLKHTIKLTSRNTNPTRTECFLPMKKILIIRLVYYFVSLVPVVVLDHLTWFLLKLKRPIPKNLFSGKI
jgi:hypothetical protein